MCLDRQGTDTLSYFYYHLLCCILCKHTPERWAFTGLGSLHACATELYGPKSRSLSAACGEVLAEGQGKGFAGILAFWNVPGVCRA